MTAFRPDEVDRGAHHSSTGEAAYELRSSVNGLTVMAWPALDALGVDAVVTTRDGGVSTGPYRSLNLALHVGDDPGAVIENRRRAAGAIGAASQDLVFADQVHGRAVTVVTAQDRGRGATRSEDAFPGSDALVTDQPGPVLVTLVADCVPVVLFDPAARVLATVHAGWRGTAARVVDAALDAMTSLGSSPDRVVAGIGPGVSPLTYHVGQEVVTALRACFGDSAKGVVAPAPGGSSGSGEGLWLVDLWAANRRILEEAGVQAGAIHLAGVPTGVGSPFFSDRVARPCGRFALLARLRP